MSIRQGLLALLAEAPMYGYQLRSEFEARTGGTWPLNIGQVYTTLARLERDDLVAPAGATDDGNERWALTDDGRAELTSWWATPVSRDAPARDELATLAAVGASPQVRLRVAGAQAGVVSVLGVLLGVLAGAVLGAVVVLMNRFPALGFDPTGSLSSRGRS